MRANGSAGYHVQMLMGPGATKRATGLIGTPKYGICLQ